MLSLIDCKGDPKHAFFYQRHQSGGVALDLQAHIPPSQGSGKLEPAHHSCGHNSSISPGSCSGLNEAAEKAPQEMQPLRHKKAGPAIYKEWAEKQEMEVRRRQPVLIWQRDSSDLPSGSGSVQ